MRIIILTFILFCQFLGFSQNSPRETKDFNKGWHFHLGEIAEFEKGNIDTSEWELVNLPHDYSIKGKIEKSNPSGSGWGYFPVGIGCYIKEISYNKNWDHKRIFIDFDGVQDNSQVWINGHLLGLQKNGYQPFRYELTSYLNKNGKNIIAVKTNTTEQMSSRWYAGSGINRDVKLLVVNQNHIDARKVQFITKACSKKEATLTVNFNNVSDILGKKIEISLIDDSGAISIITTSKKITEDFKEIKLPVLENPNLWSPEQPNLYTLSIKLFEGERVLDVYQQKVGIRSIKMDPNTGMTINGNSTKLKGVCNHHDLGPIGAIANESGIRRRLLLLKEIGCNSIRTAHNVPSKLFIELCDEIGFFVLEESFDTWYNQKRPMDDHLHFSETWESTLEAMILRDRNSPSVIMWSVGNEVMLKHRTEKGVQTVKNLVAKCHELDATRPVTTGDNFIFRSNEIGIAQELDVVGYNEGGASCLDYEIDHKTYPNRLMYGSETPHTWQTRGVYKSTVKIRNKGKSKKELGDAGWEMGAKGEEINTAALLDGTNRHIRYIDMEDLAEQEIWPEESNRYASGYDIEFLVMSARAQWVRTRDLPFVMGEFRWTGFDYIGESKWPRIVNPSGIIDYCGFPKDHYYLYQSMWTEKPMIHILPHWTHKGKEGIVIPVWIYTNADEAELFLNGKSLGRKIMDKNILKIDWNVPYQEGRIEAVAYKNGKEVARTFHETAGEASDFNVKIDHKELKVGSNELAYIEVTIIDKNGTPVPYADNLVSFELEGNGELVGIGNGDVYGKQSYVGNEIKAFRSKCLVVVKPTDKVGDIKIKVKSEGLKTKEILLKSVR
jgi:beta-galactosidase